MNQPPTSQPRLLNQMRDRIRAKHMSRSTEKNYVNWVIKYIHFHQLRHPREMGLPEIDQFLTHLAVDRHVSASTQIQAWSGIKFLYKEVLGVDMRRFDNVVRARRSHHMPVVLTAEEVAGVLDQLKGLRRLMLLVLYGAGLRIGELLSVRVKDVDFGRGQLLVRNAKGMKDRYTLLAKSATDSLKTQLDEVRHRHQEALCHGYGGVWVRRQLDRRESSSTDANLMPGQSKVKKDRPVTLPHVSFEE